MPDKNHFVNAKSRKILVIYHKTKNPFGVHICMSTIFQLLLYTMKVKSPEDQVLSLEF